MTGDLARHHGPIGDLISAPLSTSEYEKFRLSEEQIQFFNEFGYLAGLPILDQRLLSILRGELIELLDPNHSGHELFYEYYSNESLDPNRVLFHALGAWRVTPGFHDLLWHPAFLVPAAQLLEGAVRFWHDQLFCKPAYHGGVVAWHQDYSYWTRTTPLAHLTCWIALDDATRENGCLQYVPGSHRWPDLPVTGLTGEMKSIDSVLTEQQRREFTPVAIELRAGECSFHHPRMIHGSYENTTSGPRRGTVINVIRDGVLSNTDGPLLTDGVKLPAESVGSAIIPRGQKLSGRFFPLLYDPTSR